jgi:hypothetical protein
MLHIHLYKNDGVRKLNVDLPVDTVSAQQHFLKEASGVSN